MSKKYKKAIKIFSFILLTSLLTIQCFAWDIYDRIYTVVKNKILPAVEYNQELINLLIILSVINLVVIIVLLVVVAIFGVKIIKSTNQISSISRIVSTIKFDIKSLESKIKSDITQQEEKNTEKSTSCFSVDKLVQPSNEKQKEKDIFVDESVNQHKKADYNIFQDIIECCDLTYDTFMEKIDESPVACFYDSDFASTEIMFLLFSIIKSQFNESSIQKIACEFEKNFDVSTDELKQECKFYDEIINGKSFRTGYTCVSSIIQPQNPIAKCSAAFCDVIVNPKSKNYDIYDIMDSVYSPSIDTLSYAMFYSKIIEPIFNIFYSTMKEAKTNNDL